MRVLVPLAAAAALGLAAPAALAQRPSEEAVVATARTRYAAIERDARALSCRVHALQESTEGGEATVCRAGRQLRRVTAVHLGEMGRVRVTYYVWTGDRLFFVLRQSEGYAEPLRADGRLRRTEERFYFDDAGRLVRWLGEGHRARSTLTSEARNEARNLAADVRRFAAMR